jgi:hypothetical protein
LKPLSAGSRLVFNPDLIEEAAALWESLSQNRAFVDDDKRTACAAAYTLLAINGARLTSDSRRVAPSKCRPDAWDRLQFFSNGFDIRSQRVGSVLLPQAHTTRKSLSSMTGMSFCVRRRIEIREQAVSVSP